MQLSDHLAMQINITAANGEQKDRNGSAPAWLERQIDQSISANSW